MMAPTTDLQIAVIALTAKKRRYDKLWAYYDGEAPLIYTSQKLREIFSGLDAKFTENWCAVVVDSVLDRMTLQSIAVSDDDDTTIELKSLWESTGIVDDEFAVHEDVAVTGEAFVIVWPNEDGMIEAFQNDSRLCHAEYDGENPRRMRFAAKWWNDADGAVRLTMYYPDRFEYWRTKRAFKDGETPDAKAFEPLGDEAMAPNDYGKIPVFHFRSNRRKPKSQLAGAIEVQDMVNKMLADMMVAAEFGAFPQRYVISGGGITGLKNNPNEIWDLVASDAGTQATQAGQFAATSLDNYLGTINKLSADIGIITRTPRHYFYAQGGDPSGEALIAMEAPLNKKVTKVQGTLNPTWRDLAAFILLLAGSPIVSQQINVIYAPPETVQPKTNAEIRELNVRAGMPLTTVLRDEGWTDADLEEMYADMEAERVQQASYADAVLGQAQKQFDQGVAV
jgi:hypothetical protein